jgi:sucrose phosphorylase
MATRMKSLLRQLYADDVADQLAARIAARIQQANPHAAQVGGWHPADVLLITYADAFYAEDESPLATLRRFLQEYVSGVITHVHLLPFFPYTSDDGFAVSDYRTVAENNGSWDDVLALSRDVSLAFDLVINHASSSHRFFKDLLADRPPGNAYFLTADPDEDVTEVTRPRASDLLQPFETKAGTRHVWCTFSRDQVDWDFSNPDVLYECIDVFVTYLERGASWVRLDAIAYLWKELGTNCVHLPQTHAAVKLLRLVSEAVLPGTKILTETNVPLAENLSYFGDGDEAHIVYNFSLPPLLVHALVTMNGRYLTDWCRSLPTLPAGCTYLNFTASHDGIGLRPAEGILDDDELSKLVGCVEAFGGLLTYRSKPDGSLSPYEANIALFDVLKGTTEGEDQWQVERFLVSQAIMSCFAGVPAFYYNSLVASPNNMAGLAETKRNRVINRKKWSTDEIAARFSNSESSPSRVLGGIRDFLQVRTAHDAFHPEASQECVDLDERLFILRRESLDSSQTVTCVFNLTDQSFGIGLNDLGIEEPSEVSAIFVAGQMVVDGTELHCGPYGMFWFQADS